MCVQTTPHSSGLNLDRDDNTGLRARRVEVLVNHDENRPLLLDIATLGRVDRPGMWALLEVTVQLRVQ